MSKNKKQKARGSISERLGIPTASKLTAKVIREKIAILKQNLKKEKYKGDLEKQAKYYVNWYSWRLKRGVRTQKGRKAVSGARRKAA